MGKVPGSSNRVSLCGQLLRCAPEALRQHCVSGDVRQTCRATSDRSSLNVHEVFAVWIVNGCDRHRRSCHVRYASCCPVQDVVCSVERAVSIFAALFYSHGSRPDRRPVSWQGASLAWDTILSEAGNVHQPCASALFHKLVKLHCRFRALQAARVAHDLFMSCAAKVSVDISFSGPLGIRNKFMRISASK